MIKQEFNQVEIINQNPKLIEDTNLFRLLLPPSELYTLKYFFSVLHPINIREVYTNAVQVVFVNVFEPNNPEVTSNPSYKYFVKGLVNAGYGGVIIDKKEQRKVMKQIFRDRETKSYTDLTKLYHKALREHKSKVPSYDKFQTIFSKFEKRGIIYKVAIEGKIILYGLNPKFYTLFKDKREEIINL